MHRIRFADYHNIGEVAMQYIKRFIQWFIDFMNKDLGTVSVSFQYKYKPESKNESHSFFKDNTPFVASWKSNKGKDENDDLNPDYDDTITPLVLTPSDEFVRKLRSQIDKQNQIDIWFAEAIENSRNNKDKDVV